jgi:hypothetical protein
LQQVALTSPQHCPWQQLWLLVQQLLPLLPVQRLVLAGQAAVQTSLRQLWPGEQQVG